MIILRYLSISRTSPTQGNLAVRSCELNTLPQNEWFSLGRISIERDKVKISVIIGAPL